MSQGPLVASAKQGTLEMEVIVKVSMKIVPVQNIDKIKDNFFLNTCSLYLPQLALIFHMFCSVS
jgi:hypothetical protein